MATIKNMVLHLATGGTVFFNTDYFDTVSWISNGHVYHLKRTTIKSLYTNKTIKNAYLCGYSNEIKLTN